MNMTPAIKHAAEENRFNNIELLVQHGAIDAIDSNDQHTALTYVIDEGELDTTTFLLSKGADPHIPNGAGMTAVQYAASRGNLEALALILEHAGDDDGVIEAGLSDLRRAAVEHYRERIRRKPEGQPRQSAEIHDAAIFKLMDASGLRELTSRVTRQLLEDAGVDFGMKEPIIDSSLGEVLRLDSILPLVERAFESSVDAQALAEYDEFLRSPSFSRIILPEKSDARFASTGASEAVTDMPGERGESYRALLESLEVRLGTSALLTEVKVEMARSILTGHQALIPSDDRASPVEILERLEPLRPVVADSSRVSSLTTMNAMYVTISEDDLRAFVRLWDTPVGVRLSEALRLALFEGFLELRPAVSESYQDAIVNLARESYRVPTVNTDEFDYVPPSDDWYPMPGRGANGLAVSYLNLASRMMFTIRKRAVDEPPLEESDYGAGIMLLQSRSSESEATELARKSGALRMRRASSKVASSPTKRVCSASFSGGVSQTIPSTY